MRPVRLARFPLLILLPVGLAWAPPAAAEDAPAAAAPEVPTGIVRVRCPVPHATVHIDHEPAGEAPLTRYLPAGPHTIRVTADGYDPFVRKVTIETGTTTDVTAQLLAGGGTVEFHVEPPGGRLIINKKQQWPLPVRLRDLAPGDYAWRVEVDGHEPVEGNFSFVAGRNLFIAQRLRSSAGLFAFTSTPPGARVWLDGEPRGVTPLELTGVPAGPHSARLELDGYATVIRAVDTSSGGKGTVDVRLRDEGASLVVRTGRPDAEVVVDGSTIGVGTVVRLPSLERGHYELAVRAPSAAPATTRVDLPPEGRQAWRARLGAEASSIERARPLWTRWWFWTAVGVGAAGSGTAGYLVWKAGQPEPEPEGDVIVVLP